VKVLSQVWPPKLSRLIRHLPSSAIAMTIDLESSASSFLDDLDFDESDVAFLEQVTSTATSDSALHNSSSTILDELDEEMFSSTLQGDDDDEALGLREERLPSLFNSSAARRNSLLSYNLDNGDRSHPAPSKRSSLVTPEPPSEDSAASFPNPHELQRQYQHTLRKLAKSMRRSDATRSIVKRQKPMTFKGVASAVRQGRRASMYNFFQSERCKELEESRRQLLRFINI
jgi:hypothetical protein